MERSIYFKTLSYSVWYFGIFNTLEQVPASAKTLFGVFARKETANFSSMIGGEGQPVHNCKSAPQCFFIFWAILAKKKIRKQDIKLYTFSSKGSFATQAMRMYSRCNNFRDFPKSLWHPHILFYITYQGVGTCSWDSYHSLIMIYSKPDMQKHSFAHGHIKKYPNLKRWPQWQLVLQCWW